MYTKIPILCIVGPTASGKTNRAIDEAISRNGEVISVDSRQVYKFLNIGTEKISEKEMRGIKHHLIDICDPKITYSASDFVRDADKLITDIHSRGKLPILAGGTHFYFDALLNGLPESTPINQNLRDKLEKISTEELYKKITKTDQRRALELDPKNRRRLVRAIEIVTALGKVPERTSQNIKYNTEWIILESKTNELRTLINNRLKNTLDNGLIDEVKKIQEYVGDKRLDELGLEYRIIGKYLRGEIAEEELFQTISSKLWQYARRQKAWLRKLEKTFIT